MQNFHNLRVYQKAFDLSKEIYKDVKTSNQYRIRDQILGSATSICANLAEMSSFDNKNQLRQKVKICIGETNETEFWVSFLRDIKIISKERSKKFLGDLKLVRMMLYGLLKKI